jgi:ribosomal-protein-alanine N-acetyltransferase
MLMHKGTQIINTDRLLLRRYKLTDAYDMFKNWANDCEVSKFLSWKPHSNVEVIGGISIVKLDEKNYSCEIGYCMSRKYWGKGIMSEALRVVVNYLFSEVGFNRIAAKHDTNNIASGKVMIKSGMKYEGTLREVKLRNDKEFYDLAIYGILKADWVSNNEQ